MEADHDDATRFGNSARPAPTVEPIGFVAYGVSVHIAIEHHCNHECRTFRTLGDDIARILPPGTHLAPTSPSPDPDAIVITVTCAGTRVTVSGPHDAPSPYESCETALHGIDQTIRSTIALGAPGLVFIHAGSVAIDDRVIVLPGHSMTGKTTLVAAMVRAGATYLSDEYAVFDSDGLVWPYARRLSVRSETGRREVPASDLGGTTAQEALPVGLIAALHFDPDGTWQIHEAGAASCTEALLANAVAAQTRSSEVLATSARAGRTVPFIEGTRGEADEAARMLIDLAHRNQRSTP